MSGARGRNRFESEIEIEHECATSRGRPTEMKETAINVKSSDGLDNKCSGDSWMNNNDHKTHSCQDIIVDGIQTIRSFE